MQLERVLSQCEGKEKYESYALASKVMQRRNRRDRSRREGHVNIYKCECCGSFHMGTRPRFQRRPVIEGDNP